MIEEVWKNVVGFENIYEVSNIGRVRRILAKQRASIGKILKQNLGNSYGHLKVSLYYKPIRKDKFVHRLVLEAFVGPCPKGMEGCHNDGNVSNNNLENLRWDTHKSNIHDKKLHGTFKPPPLVNNRGELCGNSKLVEKEVIAIRSLFKRGVSQKWLAEWFDISKPTVSMIINRKRWSHLGMDVRQ